MAVSEDDVRHVADLARLGLEPDRLPVLARELSAILDHMDVLQAQVPDSVEPMVGPPGATGELRADVPGPDALQHARETMAPAMREGFFLVPRLAAHEDAGA